MHDTPSPPAARVAILAFAAALLASGGCYRKPSVALRDAGIAAMDVRAAQLVFDVEVRNPNEFQIGMWGLEYTLSAVGQEVASGALARPLAPIGGMETSTVRVPVTIEYDRLRPMVDSLHVREPIRWEFAAKATFNYLGLWRSVKLRRRGEMPPLRAPSWRFSDLKLTRQGSDAVAQLVFAVVNPNGFELPLVGLTGALTHGDEVLLRVDHSGMAPAPPRKTAQITVPVRLAAPGAAEAVAKALGDPRPVRFEGELRLAVPAKLRSLLFDPGDE